MVKLIAFLFSGCWHRWKVLREETLRSVNSKAVGSRYHLQCQRCGNIKFKDHF